MEHVGQFDPFTNEEFDTVFCNVHKNENTRCLSKSPSVDLHKVLFENSDHRWICHRVEWGCLSGWLGGSRDVWVWVWCSWVGVFMGVWWMGVSMGMWVGGCV